MSPSKSVVDSGDELGRIKVAVRIWPLLREEVGREEVVFADNNVSLYYNSHRFLN